MISEGASSSTQPTPSTAEDNATPNSKGLVTRCIQWKTTLEHCIEEPLVQIFVLLLIYLDVFLGSWAMISQVANSSTANASEEPFHHFRCIILYLHAFELLLQMAIFHVRFFAHWGYAIDTFIIASRILKQHSFTWIQIGQCSLHLLCFLRIWRFVRLINTYIAIEIQKHNATKKELSFQRASVEQYKQEALILQNDVERVKGLQNQSKQIAKGCRDEVAMLREALKIAAQDVAQAMMQDGNKCGGDDDDASEALCGLDVVVFGEKEEDDEVVVANGIRAEPLRAVVEDGSIDQ